MHQHRTKILRDPNGEFIPIDEGISDLIAILWLRNYKTTNSCQDSFVISPKSGNKEHFVWIMFDRPVTAAKFIREYIGRDESRYVDVQGDWELNMYADNTNVEYVQTEEDPEGSEELVNKLPFKLVFPVSVRFPIDQLKKVKNRFIELDVK